MNIYTPDEISKLTNYPALEDGRVYIYAIQNEPHKNVKIGKTSNIKQRITSLSGSNGGGSKISKIYLSPVSTWLHSIEGTCHNHFHYCRIPGTEWFDGSKVTFEEAAEYIESLFYSKGYNLCNLTRYNFIKENRDSMYFQSQSNLHDVDDMYDDEQNTDRGIEMI